MKAEKLVQTRTVSGMVESKAFHIWHENVEGATVTLALHAAPENPDELMVSELSTGFCIGSKVMRPGTLEALTVAQAKALPGKLVRRQCRTAFHHLLKQRGSLNFLRSVANAQIKVAKIGEMLNDDHAKVKINA